MKDRIIDSPYFYFEIVKGGVIQVHHLYLGLVMMIVSTIFVFTASNLWVVLVFKIFTIIGWIIYTDDLVQHMKQGRNKDYRSPLHKLGTKISVPFMHLLYKITKKDVFLRM